MDVYSVVDIISGDKNNYTVENLASNTSYRFKVYIKSKLLLLLLFSLLLLMPLVVLQHLI